MLLQVKLKNISKTKDNTAFYLQFAVGRYWAARVVHGGYIILKHFFSFVFQKTFSVLFFHIFSVLWMREFQFNRYKVKHKTNNQVANLLRNWNVCFWVDNFVVDVGFWFFFLSIVTLMGWGAVWASSCNEKIICRA